MKWVLALGILLSVAAAAALADDSGFSRRLAPADFAAAGLGKLSPDELARLDRLVGDFQGASAAAQKAAEARAKRAEADASAARAAQAAAEKRAQGFLAKTRALLLPGAEIEYQPLETRIAGALSGWEPGTLLRLENGQIWRVDPHATSYYGDKVEHPKARIVPAPMTGFKIEIDGFPDVRVRLVSGQPSAK
jgi:hypothetical protein